MRVENKVIAQADEIKNSPKRELQAKPLLSLLLFSISPILFLFDMIDIYMAVFIVFISTLSYIDMLRNWVPDILIHIVSWYGLICVMLGFSGNGIIEQSLSAILYVTPFVIINLLSFLRYKGFVFASGDLYIALSIGLWSNVFLSISSSSIAILLAFTFVKIKKINELAFIPFMLIPLILIRVIY
ncbi:prepilin peptidase [Xenorhabdus bovienii]|uniref:prepilin peptidase n=1 Tax=Xenorhabdus bovienii TaxID=40576 RepID=UPI003DA24CA2